MGRIGSKVKKKEGRGLIRLRGCGRRLRRHGPEEGKKKRDRERWGVGLCRERQEKCGSLHPSCISQPPPASGFSHCCQLHRSRPGTCQTALKAARAPERGGPRYNIRWRNSGGKKGIVLTINTNWNEEGEEKRREREREKRGRGERENDKVGKTAEKRLRDVRSSRGLSFDRLAGGCSIKHRAPMSFYYVFHGIWGGRAVAGLFNLIFIRHSSHQSDQWRFYFGCNNPF